MRPDGDISTAMEIPLIPVLIEQGMLTTVADLLSTLPFRIRCDCSKQPACPLSDLPHTRPSTADQPRTLFERFCRDATPILPPMNPVTPDISHFASEIVKKEFAMAELDYAQSIVNIVQDPQPGLMQFGRIEIDRGRGHLTLTSSTRLVSWSTFWKTIMKERITVNRTFFISLFIDCVQSVFRRHKLGLGQEVLSEDDIFLDVECNIEMLQLNAHSFFRNEPNSQSFVIVLEKSFQEFISFGHAIAGMGVPDSVGFCGGKWLF
ncbi:hypothetical protein BLNAU_5559 [Blattamonas nauphoetae]|uniref:Uncharacterized protein n=1 Tax=Blattamonas nauphoetae TaxID=2049346 RepID=A0ABQ9Y746_9EUKA|nr:hypothetical protein BLNAU_5559 [Blattamonas nauphoetae]